MVFMFTKKDAVRANFTITVQTNQFDLPFMIGTLHTGIF